MKKILCNNWCLLSLVLIMSSLSICTFSHKKLLMSDFMQTLDETQKKEYQEIILMRRNIYMRSLLAAAVVSFISCLVGLKEKTFSINSLCVFMALMFSFKNLFYLLSKKSKYMVTSLNNEKQRRAWLEIYKNMQYRYHMGIFVGLIGVIIISISYCKGL